MGREKKNGEGGGWRGRVKIIKKYSKKKVERNRNGKMINHYNPS